MKYEENESTKTVKDCDAPEHSDTFKSALAKIATAGAVSSLRRN
jgi:hypothetical protein